MHRSDGRVGGLIDQDIILDTIRNRRRWPTDTKSADTKKARDAAAVAEHGRARSASQIIISLGDPECPSDKPPSAQLFREARLALGLSQKALAWKLGALSPKSGAMVSQIEAGTHKPSRATRLLLRVELRKLELHQQSLKIVR